MATEILPKYHCTQTELYAICRLGWNIAKQYQTNLAFKFPYYTIPFIDAKLTAVNDAQELPDFQNRDFASETARIILKQKADFAIENWKLLERYIINALQSDKDLIKPHLEAAGKDYYDSATRENPDWEDLKQMLIDGKKYITDNSALLIPFMPATFATDFDSTKADFQNQYDTFLAAETTTPVDTNLKINANNQIYDALMLLIGDCKAALPTLFRDSISFNYLKSIITSPGPAGLKGTVTSTTNTPLSGALLRLVELALDVTTNSEGQYDFGNIRSGSYTLQISLSGFLDFSDTVVVLTGVTSTKNYQLTANP